MIEVATVHLKTFIYQNYTLRLDQVHVSPAMYESCRYAKSRKSWRGHLAAALSFCRQSGAPLPEGQKRMVTVMLFGSASECENARRLIEEACDNKEQKAKQRAKEYEKKKDEKRRDRQLYHMRHTHDYEELELPLGASKVCPLQLMTGARL